MSTEMCCDNIWINTEFKISVGLILLKPFGLGISIYFFKDLKKKLILILSTSLKFNINFVELYIS